MTLELLRFEIDEIDDQIVDLLISRFRCLDRVAAIKMREGLAGHDPMRERAIMERVFRKISQAGLSFDQRRVILQVSRNVLDEGREYIKRCLHEARHDRPDRNAMDAGARLTASKDAPKR